VTDLSSGLAVPHPQPAPSLSELQDSNELGRVLPRIFAARVGPEINGHYLHWDELRRRQPPADLDARLWWLGVKLARTSSARELPLRAVDGSPFRYSLPDRALELLHWLDQHAAGEIVVTETIKDAGDRGRYLVNSLFEEAITSSQLEGASSTRRVAKEMLRTGRPPRDLSERMIINNYRAMTQIHDLAQRSLTEEDVFMLHRLVTEETLEDPTAAGRLQRPDEIRVVVEDNNHVVAHVPPPATELPDRLNAMISFANDDGSSGFMHPVIRAILLHLWLAYDHPFEDGNGRTARALFYRQMLASGYWLFEYVTISRLLVKAPMQYARAFLYTETDEYDATYFILHQLEIARRAIEELHGYLQRKMAEVHETIRLLRRADLNHRQIALLTNALRHPDAVYTFKSHALSHRVVRQSARTDLLDLERRGYLVRRTIGTRHTFEPAQDLQALVSRVPAAAPETVGDAASIPLWGDQTPIAAATSGHVRSVSPSSRRR
jgi:Fic family protein